MKSNLLFGSYMNETFELDWDENLKIMSFESSYDFDFEIAFKLFLYDFEKAKYDELLITVKVLSKEKITLFFRYAVLTYDLEAYKERIKYIFKYSNNLENESYSIYDSAYNEYPELRKLYSLYPSNLNSIMEKSFDDFVYTYFKKSNFERYCNCLCENYNGSIYFSSLDPDFYELFAENGIISTIEYKLKKAYITQSNNFLNKIEGICIGNEICFNLMPQLDTIKKIIAEAKKIGFKLMFVFPPLQEDNVTYFENIVKVLDELFSCRDAAVEVICNDWGAIHYLKTFNYVHITIGSLLNKYLRDPRKLPYRVKSNFFASSQMETLYRTYNVTSILHSIPENVEEFNVLHNYLLFPFACYMSSEFCPLISALIEKNVYRERPDDNCKKLCKHFVRMYPKHLQCIGIGKANFVLNNNFMFDLSLLEKVKSLSNRLIYLDVI